jgi:hypothetical protein
MKIPKKPYLEIINVTPEKAAEWLSKMGVNRNPNGYRVQSYATSILNKKWLLTQPLEIDWNGEPINGQHRLLSVVESNTPVQMLVLFDVDPEAKTVIDSHRPRSNTDIKTIVEGTRADPKLAPTVTMIDSFLSSQRQQMSYQQMATLEERFKGSLDWTFGAFKGATKLIATTPVRAAFAFAYLTNTAMVSKFAKQVITGENLKTTDIAYNLRYYLTEGQTIKKDDRRNQGVKVLTAIWAFLNGEELPRVYEKNGVVEYFAALYPELKVASPTQRFEYLKAISGVKPLKPEVKEVRDSFLTGAHAPRTAEINPGYHIRKAASSIARK